MDFEQVFARYVVRFYSSDYQLPENGTEFDNLGEVEAQLKLWERDCSRPRAWAVIANKAEVSAYFKDQLRLEQNKDGHLLIVWANQSIVRNPEIIGCHSYSEVEGQLHVVVGTQTIDVYDGQEGTSSIVVDLEPDDNPLLSQTLMTVLNEILHCRQLTAKGG